MPISATAIILDHLAKLQADMDDKMRNLLHTPYHYNSAQPDGVGERDMRSALAAINALLEKEAAGDALDKALPLLRDFTDENNASSFAAMVKFAGTGWQRLVNWRNCASHKARLADMNLADPEAAFKKMAAEIGALDLPTEAGVAVSTVATKPAPAAQQNTEPSLLHPGPAAPQSHPKSVSPYSTPKRKHSTLSGAPLRTIQQSYASSSTSLVSSSSQDQMGRVPKMDGHMPQLNLNRPQQATAGPQKTQQAFSVWQTAATTPLQVSRNPQNLAHQSGGPVINPPKEFQFAIEELQNARLSQQAANGTYGCLVPERVADSTTPRGQAWYQQLRQAEQSRPAVNDAGSSRVPHTPRYPQMIRPASAPQKQVRREDEHVRAWKRARAEQEEKDLHEAERIKRVKVELKAEQAQGNDILTYRYREYMDIYGRKEVKSRYYLNFLANQFIQDDDNSESAMAVRYAKEKWYKQWKIEDKAEVIKKMREEKARTEAQKLDAELKSGGHLITAADIGVFRKTAPQYAVPGNGILGERASDGAHGKLV